jgi:pimeloyl-ACP methyl ester carboxylesterase
MITTHKSQNGKYSIELHTYGSGGEPLLFLHGAGGLMPAEPYLEELGRDFKVYAPHLPGYGDSTGNEHIDDVIDVALFYHQLMDELGIPSANVVGHSMGGMFAAELTALCNHRTRKLVLVAPAGFWLDDHPIPDLFAAPLDEIAPLLFHDPNSPAAKLMTAIPEDFKALETMYVERVKRFAMASKFLWPIPDRGLKKRAYRISAPTLLLWGESDRLIPPVYAKEFTSRIKNAKLATIPQAGHMVMYEQQPAFVRAVREFLKG